MAATKVSVFWRCERSQNWRYNALVFISMAEIFPFRAWRYDPGRVELSSVVTQPYDKITPQMQERYYAASPHNLVRIILGKTAAGDGPGENVYTRAAETFTDWRKNGILVQDEQPGIYAYSQRFVVPEGGGETLERQGFIALGRIYDYDEEVVFRHEQTLAKPKADRLELLRATRANFGQIFMLYSDPQMKIERLLSSAGSKDIEIDDEYGVKHVMRRVHDPGIVKAVQQQMAEKKLLIADGHHRYETALAYRNERCAEERKEGSCAGEQPASFECAMMTFVNMDAQGIVILATHRVLSGIGEEQTASLIESAKQFFDVRELRKDVAKALDELKKAKRAGTALLMVTARTFWLLIAKKDAVQRALSHVPEVQRTLDVVALHKVILEKILGLSEDAILNQQNISYHRDAGESIRHVQNGSADCAFLMNPVQVEQVRDVAFAGEVMPQKSTDFYPKLLSGLTIYELD
jgi:uncharacterized protein (DUF1015 family)